MKKNLNYGRLWIHRSEISIKIEENIKLFYGASKSKKTQIF